MVSRGLLSLPLPGWNLLLTSELGQASQSHTLAACSSWDRASALQIELGEGRQLQTPRSHLPEIELLRDTGAGINNADTSLFLRRNYSLGLGGDERGNPVFVPQAFRVELPSHLPARRGACCGSDATESFLTKI